MNVKENVHLKQLRLKFGYTQEYVAERLGVTKATISKYEKGQRNIKTEYIEKLAELYSVEPIYILTGKTSEDWRKEMDENVAASEREEEQYWRAILFSGSTGKLVELFDQLTEDGKKKALERVSELTEIPKYQAR